MQKRINQIKNINEIINKNMKEKKWFSYAIDYKSIKKKYSNSNAKYKEMKSLLFSFAKMIRFQKNNSMK